MKKRLLIILAISSVFASCKPDLKGELGSPFDNVAGISGVWEVTSFVQQDPNNPIREERDLSEFYIIPGETPYRLVLEKESRAYIVEQGPGKNYFGDGGTWAFDNDGFPTKLFLYSATDTTEIVLGSVVRSTDNLLNLDIENFCEDTSGVKTQSAIYKFSFIRVN